MYYGLTTKEELNAHIRRACQSLSPSTVQDAIPLLSGTAATETHFGEYEDRSEGYGFGPWQFDRIRVVDIARYIRTLDRVHAIVLAETGFDARFYDVDTICHILKFSPLLGAFFCRIGYMMKPEPLPSGSDIEAQGEYYKRHWNSSEGKGSVEKYVHDYKKFYLGVDV